MPCAARRRVRRAYVRRTRAKRTALQRRVPRLNLSRLRRVTLAALSPSIARARSSLLTAWPSGPARRRCALEAVEKVVTAKNDPSGAVPLMPRQDSSEATQLAPLGCWGVLLGRAGAVRLYGYT